MLPGLAIPRSNDEIEPCLCVVMPVYNEASSLPIVVERVLAQRPVQEVGLLLERGAARLAALMLLLLSQIFFSRTT